MWLVIVQVEIQGLIFFLYTHIPAPFAEGTVFPSTYILTSFQKKSMDCNCMGSYHSFLLHSLRLYISFCFDDFAVYLEIRYGNSSSVVCREACTDLQSGSCLGQKFSDNWWTEYCFFLVSSFVNATVLLSPPYSGSLNVHEFYLYNGKSTSILK